MRRYSSASIAGDLWQLRRRLRSPDLAIGSRAAERIAICDAFADARASSPAGSASSARTSSIASSAAGARCASSMRSCPTTAAICATSTASTSTSWSCDDRRPLAWPTCVARRRRRVQPRRPGQPHGVDARPGNATCSSTPSTHAQLPRDAPRASTRRARVVHASTRQVYGRPLRVPVDEAHPAQPGRRQRRRQARRRAAAPRLRARLRHGDHVAAADQRLRPAPATDQRRAGLPAGVHPHGAAAARRSSSSATAASAATACTSTTSSTRMLAATDRRGRRAGVQRRQPTSTTRWPRSPRSSIDAAGSTAARSRCVPWPADHQRIDIGSFRSDSSAIAAALGWQAADRARGRACGARSTFYREHPWYLSST